jgi:hypothetical protein
MRYHDLDTVLIDGYGTVTRAQARNMVRERSLQTGRLVYENKLPGGYMELTLAAHHASISPAYIPYAEPILPSWAVNAVD